MFVTFRLLATSFTGKSRNRKIKRSRKLQMRKGKILCSCQLWHFARIDLLFSALGGQETVNYAFSFFEFSVFIAWRDTSMVWPPPIHRPIKTSSGVNISRPSSLCRANLLYHLCCSVCCPDAFDFSVVW